MNITKKNSNKKIIFIGIIIGEVVLFVSLIAGGYLEWRKLVEFNMAIPEIKNIEKIKKDDKVIEQATPDATPNIAPSPATPAPTPTPTPVPTPTPGQIPTPEPTPATPIPVPVPTPAPEPEPTPVEDPYSITASHCSVFRQVPNINYCFMAPAEAIEYCKKCKIAGY
jgi:hypothetical protein